MKTVLLQAVAFSALAAVVSAQVPAGGEFLVNTYTTGDQLYPVVAGDARGNFVIVWNNVGVVNGDIRGQRYGRDGNPRGGEFVVAAPNAAGYTGAASVTMTKSGSFVVLWNESDGSPGLAEVFARRYDASGVPRGSGFRVNAYTTGPQVAGQAAVDGRGNLIVTFWDAGQRDGSAFSTWARRFDADNNPLGAEFRVHSNTNNDQWFQSVAADAAGNFVVAWTDRSYGNQRVNARVFDPGGNPVASEFAVGANTTGFYSNPSVAFAPDGSILVAFITLWEDGDAFGIAARRFTATGTPLGSQFQVNTFTTGSQRIPWLDVDSSGNFVVQWIDDAGDNSGAGIKARRFTSTDVPRSGEFLVNTYTFGDQIGAHTSPAIGGDGSGNFVVAWQSSGQEGQPTSGYRGIIARRFGGLLADALAVDTAANRVLEPGETVDVRPSWRNFNGAAQTFSAALGNITGPAGATYAIADATGDYGTVANGATAPCVDCYAVSVSNPAVRPVVHWDATAVESILPDVQGQRMKWLLHVGRSFTDVPPANPFYRFIETLLHHGVTGGCSVIAYCPGASTTREQMAVFTLVGKEGSGYVPPACTTATFNDVPVGNPFCRWVEELARRGVVGGCGGGNYCPASPVSREQMAVFMLRTADPALTPPLCAPPNLYLDVPETSPFCRWIEELTRRNVVGGCGGGNYCPSAPVTREQMGVFISATFGLVLYGP